jgi:hypothetical protein
MILHIPVKGQTRSSQLCSVPLSGDFARNVQGTEAVPSVQPVVRAATKPEVVGPRGAHGRPRLNVIELEKSPCLAAPSSRGHERTPATISQIDLTPHRGGNVTSALAHPRTTGRTAGLFALSPNSAWRSG